MTRSACTRNTYLANPREPWGFWQALPVAVSNWFSLPRMAVFVGCANKPRWGGETARRLGREQCRRSFARAFAASLLSSVPDKTAIRLRWLKLVRRVGPLRVSQNRHFVPFVLSVVGSPFCYKFCLESVPLNPNHYGFPRNRTRPCRKNRQNRSLKTWRKITWKMIFKISCAKLNSRNL